MIQRPHGCGRGVFGLKNWDVPVRRPKALLIEEAAAAGRAAALENFEDDELKSPPVKISSWADEMKTPEKPPAGTGQKLIVKYSYKANPNSPLVMAAGEKELTVSSKQHGSFLCYHPDNKLWSKIRTEDGQEGYVPSSYVMILEEEITSLPWIKPPVEVEQVAPEWKPYKSAYAKDNPEEKAKNAYFCDVCQKDFNGPQPYTAHMNSKAHKEEVEAQME